MKTNYYEILEINQNASQDIVKKAYQTLAKKYHPDLHTGEDKAKYEEKLKLINEAYEVLVDEEKRANYDALLNSSVDKEAYEDLYRQNQDLRAQVNHMRSDNSYSSTNTNNISTNNQAQEEFVRRQYEEIQRARQQAYHDAYIRDLKNRGYRIRYKKSLKDYFSIFLTIVVVIIVFIILWYIPPIHNQLVNIYNTNPAIKALVDTIVKIFNPELQIY